MSRTVSSAQQQEERRSRDEDTGQLVDDISEYEMERRRNMERNHRRLQELGLVGQGKVAIAETKALKTPRRVSRASATSTAVPVAVAVRKSLRTRSKPAPVYTDSTVGFDDETRRGRKRSRASTVGLQGSAPQSSPVIASPPCRPRAASKPSAPDSSRNLECDIPMLMKEYLGRRFNSFGKAPVMELSTKSCPPKFSRMSGVTEWKNAVFLWVNVDGGTSYENLFEGDLDLQAEMAGNGDSSTTPIHDTATMPKSPSVVPETRSEEKETEKVTRVPGGSSQEETGDATRCQSTPRVVGASSISYGDASENVGGGAAVDDDTCGGGIGLAAGLRMTWFAGGRMTAESALIQRLLLQGNSLEVREKSRETEVDTADAGRTKSGGSKPAISDDAGLGGKHEPDEDGKTDSATSATAASLEQAPKKGGSSTATSLGDLDNGNVGMEAPGDANAHGVARLLTSEAFNDTAIDGPSPEPAQPARQPKDGDGDLEEADTVLLFCRLPNEPYVFCGRLGYAKHWSAERPMRFVWKLLDAVRLAGCSDFLAIVEAAGIGTASTKEKPQFDE